MEGTWGWDRPGDSYFLAYEWLNTPHNSALHFCSTFNLTLKLSFAILVYGGEVSFPSLYRWAKWGLRDLRSAKLPLTSIGTGFYPDLCTPLHRQGSTKKCIFFAAMYEVELINCICYANHPLAQTILIHHLFYMTFNFLMSDQNCSIMQSSGCKSVISKSPN